MQQWLTYATAIPKRRRALPNTKEEGRINFPWYMWFKKRGRKKDLNTLYVHGKWCTLMLVKSCWCVPSKIFNYRLSRNTKSGHLFSSMKAKDIIHTHKYNVHTFYSPSVLVHSLPGLAQGIGIAFHKLE